jgi:hypothetical protein
VVRVLGFDFQHYQIFWEVVGLEQGLFSLVSTTEELLGRNSSGCGLEIRVHGHGDPLCWPHDTLYSQKVGTNSADKQQSLDRYTSLASYSHRVQFSFRNKRSWLRQPSPDHSILFNTTCIQATKTRCTHQTILPPQKTMKGRLQTSESFAERQNEVPLQWQISYCLLNDSPLPRSPKSAVIS